MIPASTEEVIIAKIEEGKEIIKLCKDCEFQVKDELLCMLTPSELTNQICLLRHICYMMNLIYQEVIPEIPPSI